MTRRVAIQSVLYANREHDIMRAAEALFNSATRAAAAGAIDGWEYRLGDCAPQRTLSVSALSALAEEAEARGGSVSYTFFEANLGSAAGQNRLAAESDTELMIIMNPDARMSPDTVERLVRSLRAGVGVVEARQVPLDHPKDYEQHTGDTSWASTACALTSRSVFDEVGGFDADTFFLYGDDVDYSWRVRLAGHRVVFEPAASIYHDKRLAVDAGWPTSAAERYYSAEASLMIAHKYSHSARVERLLENQRTSHVEFLERAARAFIDRRDRGALPDPIDPEHTVARFIGDVYAQHRF